MAMQDALHAYNRTASKDEEIHIRIAASLGEVRLSKGDIFGEPVNVTSRIEGITPGDEIYFSEAVYLAMNKAEVPAVEVGLMDLKGVSKPVRVYSIPRFVNSQLVPDSADPIDMDPRFNFPYGGMHISAAPVAAPWMHRFQRATTRAFRQTNLLPWVVSGIAIILGGIAATRIVSISVNVTKPSADAVPAVPARLEPTGAPTEPTTPAIEPTAAPAEPTVALIPPTNTPTEPVPLPTMPPMQSPPAQQIAALPTASSSRSAVRQITNQPVRIAALPSPAPSATVAFVPSNKSAPVRASISSIMVAKRAYRESRISKERYREIVQRLEGEMDSAIKSAKMDYKAGRLSKEAYRNRVEAIKRRYVGQ
jgi:hypothetical protein